MINSFAASSIVHSHGAAAHRFQEKICPVSDRGHRIVVILQESGGVLLDRRRNRSSQGHTGLGRPERQGEKLFGSRAGILCC